MKILFSGILVCVSLLSLNAQQALSFEAILDWNTNTSILSFENSYQADSEERLPVFMKRIQLSSGGRITAQVISTEYEELSADIDHNLVGNTLDLDARIEWERRVPYCRVAFVPIIKEGGILKKLIKCEIAISITPSPESTSNNRDNTYTSVLSENNHYKIAIPENGIYKIDYDFLNNLGVDVNNINPSQIKIHGNGGGSLAYMNNDFRYDDLVENAIHVNDESDGSFNQGDYILFYAQGPDKTLYNEFSGAFSIEKNLYDVNSHYFISVSPGNGLRIENAPNIATTNYTSSSYNDFIHFEEDKFNLLHEYIYTPGSGREWYGDKYDITNDKTYNFNFEGIDTGSELAFEIGMVARKNGNRFNDLDDSYFTTVVNGQNFQSSGMDATNLSDVLAKHASEGFLNGSINPTSDDVSLTVTYNYPGAEAWLDYITLNCRKNLVYYGNQFQFRDINSIGQTGSTFQLSGANTNLEVWDISNPIQPERISTTISGNQMNFNASTTTLTEFIAYESDKGLKTPIPMGEVINQNLHSIENVEALLIYHQDFEAAAMQLAEHRQSHSGISIATAEINEVFNEFSSGSNDPTAIRDFAKMIYDRSPEFKYLILFGDGSFDFRDIDTEIELKSNFIPVFETAESLAPIQAFPSDDYFGLLSPNEGNSLIGALDISVGRFPVTTASEANQVVEKIIYYDTSKEVLGDWRNRITFVADDEDSNTHINQADRIATIVDTTYYDFNINKIYFDAFQQVSSSGGESYPDVKSSINSSIFKGQLIVNYLGHGGPTSWAQERVLQEIDINNWQNKEAMPLFITATCSFTAYDDPVKVSAGEKTFLRQPGGTIGLYTTTRAVYSSSNERLTTAAFNNIFEKVNGEYPTIGEIMRISKNSNSADTLDTNARKFTLIGDPTMHLALPKHSVVTSSINGMPLSENDTISALEEVTITGFIADGNGNKLTGFNGIIFPTVYDKEQTVNTLANDPGSFVRQFGLQKNILFKGAASVTNGDFSFTFIVPKDIDYSYGNGRISYYAQDGESLDAAGFYEKIIIGGTAENPIQDDTPPLVEVFMNDDEFAFGGITNPNPIIYVKLSDDFGISVAGTGIGHDLTAILDENTQDVIVLNDFYEAEVDNSKKGEARFPLNGIKPGRHTLRVKGWDIANNSGEGYTEFVVAEDANVALDHVLNYPNPFTTNTEFQFEHNLAGQTVRVQVQIFTIAGNLVKTISEEMFAGGNRITGIQWDGRDDYGDNLARGVYLYKVNIASLSDTETGKSGSSEFEKLVILK